MRTQTGDQVADGNDGQPFFPADRLGCLQNGFFHLHAAAAVSISYSALSIDNFVCPKSSVTFGSSTYNSYKLWAYGDMFDQFSEVLSIVYS